MATITITSLIGYAQLYKNANPICRIPVFDASGSPGSGSSADISQDLSIFNAVYVSGAVIHGNTSSWSDVSTGKPAPDGTLKTSADDSNAITFYRDSITVVTSKISNGVEVASGSSFDPSNIYPVIIKNPKSGNYVAGGINKNLTSGWIDNKTSTRGVSVNLVILPSPFPDMINFYRSYPEGDINVNRGETVNLEFTAVYADGTSSPYTDILYSDLPPESVATFSGNSFTISENCRASIFTSIAKPNIEDTALYAFVQAKILNPVNPYLPDDGGISGGGAQSGSSNVIGSFDGTPGPSISENLPNGSSGPDIASSGMYTKYLCNNALLDLLAEFFWEDNIGIQALKAVLGNPIDSIISLTAYPFALETLVPTTQTTIYFGQYDSHFSAFSLTKSSFQIDWGTVTIPFFWGSFLDYSPYTKIQLYLPWGVGFVSLDPNEVVPWSSNNSFNQGDFVNGTIRVITNIELDKGACVHNIVGNNGRVIGSFGGVVGKQVPVTGSDNSARILAMISAAVSSSAAIGTSAGGTLAAGKNLSYGKGMSMAERAEGREMIGNYKSYAGNTVQSLSNALSSPPSYPRAGTFSDATNTLGYQYPYLIISRPSQSVPQQYGRFMGYPSNIFHAHLGEVRGYTEVSSIHLENINATANELDELESILKGGVLL